MPHAGEHAASIALARGQVSRDRRELAGALKALGGGDVLLVTRQGAAFRSLHEAWADTTTPHGRLMLTVLGGLAEYAS
jgi:DNA invertase Pin-like site-specific DNA recombinase